MLKVIVLQNFATVGTPEDNKDTEKNWNVVALSERLLDENRLAGLQKLNTRPLDLVIHNGSRFALLNLPAFKVFPCDFATDTISQCISHYVTPDGNLLFGVQSTGDVVVLTEGLRKLKNVRKPAFIKIQENHRRWYENVPFLPSLFDMFVGGGRSSKRRNNQVSPVHDPENPPINLWWLSSAHYSEHLRTKFPYLTSLPDGLAVFCAFSPVNCYIFLSSYQTALRDKSIANYRGSQVPGRWYRIIMHKNFIQKWLEDKRVVPWFEAKICYKKDENGNSSVSGAMVYAVMEGVRLELVYGIIKRRGEKFTLSWEMVQYDVDWALREPGMPYNLGCRYVATFSSDCKKLAIVIGTHLGMYVHIQQVPSYPDAPVKLKRQTCALCNHSDYDGTHFYKSECWVSDVQWLVEDAYVACMTLCGSLSIFYSSGDPMVLKVRKPGAEPDEDKSARFFFPVFHPQQLQSQPVSGSSSQTVESKGRKTVYPTIKWIDSERVLTCSSGTKMELFGIQRVLNIPTEQRPQREEIVQEVKAQEEELTETAEVKEEESVTLLLEPVKDVADYNENKNANNNNNSTESESETDEDAKYPINNCVPESELFEVVEDRLPS